MLDEANMPYSACVRCSTCDGFPCLVHAKSDAEVLAVRPALEHPNVTLLTNTEAVALRTNDAGTAVTEVIAERDGERETFTADLVVASCGAANTAKLLLTLRQRQPSQRARQRLRPGRAQLHLPQQPGGPGAVGGREPDRVPEDPRRQRLLPPRHRGLRVPDGQHPDGRQVVGADVPGREAAGDEARPDPDARGHGPPRGRLLALDRGPAPAREPGHASTATGG